ncbi:hypothetical protein HOG48_00050 [Candidatus Peregrinibacteria bacterium]|nr:hypothetical protein [Candidatus Peregrinibacteria bacterium]
MATTQSKVVNKVVKRTTVKIDKPIKLVPIFSGLFKNVSDREKQILEMRFGLEKYDKHTLEAIGQKFGITRERVRQIENVAINKLSSHTEGTDIETIVGFSASLLDANGSVLEKYCLLRELLGAIQSPAESDMNYLELSLMMSMEIKTVHNTIKFHPHYLLSSVEANVVASSTASIIGALKKKKEVIDFNSARSLTDGLSAMTIMNISKISKELKVVDGTAVGLFAWSHINPRNIHDKIMFIMKELEKPMHFNEITEAIREKNFDSKTVNVQAVHNELIRDDKFILIGRGIYALGAWGYKPGTVADVITEILGNGPLSRDEIITKVLGVRQVKKITIQLNLKNKALFERVGRSTYGLKK